MNFKYKKIIAWFVDRLGLEGTMQFLSKKTVPSHRHSFWYLFGGLSLFFFVIQILSGILLLLYYNPTSSGAHESVEAIMMTIPLGWLTRSIHVWSSHLMIISLLIHLVSTFLMRSYCKPREMMWIGGVIQLLLALGFCFTGYLLPWDTVAYFATQIGVEISKSVPVAGEFVIRLLRGGDYVDDNTLRRFFALHVVVLPLTVIGLTAIHIILSQAKGTSTPIEIKTKKEIPFFPNFLLRDIMAWTVASMLLMGLVLLAPAVLGPKAEPYASAPVGIKPEWYFLPLYQTLKIFPSTLLGVDGETIVNILVAGFVLLLLVIPFIDREETPSKLVRRGGMLAFAYLTIAAGVAYLQNRSTVGSSLDIGTTMMPGFGSRIIVLFVALFFFAILFVLLWMKKREVDEES